jgi:predicted ATPase
MNILSKIGLEGFRSIKRASFVLEPLTVLIGANGAGKSNLIDFLRMLNYAPTRGFQNPYLVERGPASAILHFGPKVTPLIRAELEFRTADGINTYRFSLADSEGDRLTFTREAVQFQRTGVPQPTPPIPAIPRPSDESGLAEVWAENDPTVRFVKSLLSRCRVYQFHDTGLTSHLRDASPLDRGRYLYADGGNLAAFLLSLREESVESYASIVRTLRLILPWFDEFILEPEGLGQFRRVLLRWRMVGHRDYEFGPGQLSDGSLRSMALVALLLQPLERLPGMIVIDEPELGLHPAAEEILAGLLKSASRHVQVLVATQSATFLDHFAAEDVVVVENEDGASTFTRQSAEQLRSWLERYTLGEIWKKNLIGGRP